MKATTNYGWAHPDPGDHTRTWEYWNTFEDVDADLKVIDDRSNNGLPSLLATVPDAIAQPGPVDKIVPFGAIAFVNQLPGAAIDGNGMLTIPVRGRYELTLSTFGNAGGWGGSIAVENSGGTVVYAFAYTSFAQHMSLADANQANIDAGAKLRVHIATGGNYTWQNVRLSLKKIAPWP